ncbi:hypothetical protein LPY66_10910 [Dehalobacter sp. DCM]|uniref:hypothetical protein n=1 Tax=Dehalobacter sp. DCM TaxID=2907827 RepID=UPI003081F235|nr:hypothetical protein LPY66_10910 [Dehalobacter sp. DCM]
MEKGNKKQVRLILASGFILIIALLISSCGKANDNNPPQHAITQPSPDFTPGNAFAPEGLAVIEGTNIADSVRGDMNSDGNPEEIILTGVLQEAVDPLLHDVKITVKDGKTGNFATASIGPDNVGYEPKLFIGSFTGAESNELFVSVTTGGSGGIVVYSLLHYVDGQISPVITQSDLNDGLPLTLTCSDGFKLTAEDKGTGYTAQIDLSKGTDDYVAMNIYDQKGKLVGDPNILLDGYSLMEAIDVNGDGLLELQGTQAISVGAHANQVARAESVWSVKDGKLQLLEEKVTPVN